ncbi:MAG: AraC family transcriptional regulator [Halanaerobiales bacterium]
MKALNIDNISNTDLNMYQCGEEECSAEHYYGPALRDHYLIHYIIEGEGQYTVNDKSYHLEKGQGFLICPDIVTFYQAAKEHPWKYTWVGFNGSKAKSYLKYANLSLDNPIFTYKKDQRLLEVMSEMVSINKITKSNELRLLSLLYYFLSILIEETNNNNNFQDTNKLKSTYIKAAVSFIEKNYSRKITIKELANNIGLDRSYLYSVFQEILEQSPQEYLINFRINKACELMNNKTLNIGDVSRSVGYKDPLYFSKIFKKIKGLSPSEYRNYLFKF